MSPKQPRLTGLDLDSIASAIAYAWLQSPSRPSIPYVQIHKADIVLRPENIYALKLAGIASPADQLLTPDDVASYHPFPATKFSLVDHNRLGPQFTTDESSVEAIIDHHEDEQAHLSANPRIVSPAGSCSSHIALICPETLPRELATLLLCAILIDTDGLKPGGKALQVDRDAAARLVPLTAIHDSSFQNVTSLHEHPSLKSLNAMLSEQKADVSGLSPRDLLRRDYKEYIYTLKWHPDTPTIKAGLATVPVRLREWAGDGQLVQAGVAYMQERGLAVLGVLTSFRKKNGKGKHAREMAWIVLGDHAAEIEERLWAGLEADGDIRVEVHDVFEVTAVDENVKVRVYKQGNANATRKVTAPLLKKILEAPS